MALSSNTYVLPKGSSAKADVTKKNLLNRHYEAVAKVLADAKTLSEDRKRDLGKIDDESLRQSAAR
jgi:hypothetical protein